MATQPERQKPVSWKRWIITVVIVLLFASSAIVWILQGIIFGHLSPVVSIVFAVTGVIVALFQWFFPLSANTMPNEVPIDTKQGAPKALEEVKTKPSLSLPSSASSMLV